MMIINNDDDDDGGSDSCDGKNDECECIEMNNGIIGNVLMLMIN